MPEGDANDQRVGWACELLSDIRRAERSKTLTMQVMPERVEIIDCKTGDYVRTFQLEPDPEDPVPAPPGGITISIDTERVREGVMHSVARILAFDEHEDWRYDPGDPDHEKYRELAAALLGQRAVPHGPPVDVDAIDRDLIRLITGVCIRADTAHETSGGGTRHWVRDHFLPELYGAGLVLVSREQFEADVAMIESVASGLTASASSAGGGWSNDQASDEQDAQFLTEIADRMRKVVPA